MYRCIATHARLYRYTRAFASRLYRYKRASTARLKNVVCIGPNKVLLLQLRWKLRYLSWLVLSKPLSFYDTNVIYFINPQRYTCKKRVGIGKLRQVMDHLSKYILPFVNLYVIAVTIHHYCHMRPWSSAFKNGEGKPCDTTGMLQLYYMKYQKFHEHVVSIYTGWPVPWNMAHFFTFVMPCYNLVCWNR